MHKKITRIGILPLRRIGRSARLFGHAKAPGCRRCVDRPPRRDAAKGSGPEWRSAAAETVDAEAIPGIVDRFRADCGSARPTGPPRWMRAGPAGLLRSRAPAVGSEGDCRAPAPSAFRWFPPSCLRGREGPVGREAPSGASGGRMLRGPAVSGRRSSEPGRGPKGTRGDPRVLREAAGSFCRRLSGRRGTADRALEAVCGGSLPSRPWSERRRNASRVARLSRPKGHGLRGVSFPEPWAPPLLARMSGPVPARRRS